MITALVVVGVVALIAVLGVLRRLYKGPCCERCERRNRVVDAIMVIGGAYCGLAAFLAGFYIVCAACGVVVACASFDTILVNSYLDSLKVHPDNPCRRSGSS